MSKASRDGFFALAERWLEAWTGNRPDELLAFYTDDALYIDPANREGLQGKDAIREYFVKLLDVYHDWKWEPIEVFPISSGMIVKWQCWINVSGDVLHEIGVDIVGLRGDKISRNEVYFDRSRLVGLVESKRRMQRLIH